MFFIFFFSRWAMGTIMTRQNTIPSFNENDIISSEKESIRMIPALIPFWDMANHDQSGYISTQFNEETLKIESTTIKEFSKGEQIFIYYADRNNTEMLVNNGFFTKDGDFCLWFNIPNGDNDYRKPLYTQAGFTSNSFSLPITQKLNYLTEKFLIAHRIFIMDQEMVKFWLNCNTLKQDELFSVNFKFDDEKMNKKFWQNILIRLKVAIAKLDDKIELHNKKGQILEMLLQYRNSEKNILTNSLKYVEEIVKKYD